MNAAVSAGILFALTISAFAFTRNEPTAFDNSSHGACGRIVSLAPSITETLFALDLGGDVVGVTRFCKYPPEVSDLPKVGGFIDPNYEAILSLKPDTVIAMTEQEDVAVFLRDKVPNVFTLNAGTVSSILESLQIIGEKCGKTDKAREVAVLLNSRMDAIRRNIPSNGEKKKKVMITVGRSMGTGSISDLFISGVDGFYDKLIEIAGGENVYRGATIKFPTVSREGILRLNPDIIIEMIPEPDQFNIDTESVKKEWRKHLSSVSAVKTGNVYIFTDDFSVIPGPRFILVLEKLARVIETSGKDAEFAGK